jgi:hypothetical protein
VIWGNKTGSSIGNVRKLDDLVLHTLFMSLDDDISSESSSNGDENTMPDNESGTMALWLEGSKQTKSGKSHEGVCKSGLSQKFPDTFNLLKGEFSSL